MANAVYDDQEERQDLPPGIEPGPGMGGAHDDLGMSSADRDKEVNDLEEHLNHPSEGNTDKSIKRDKLNEAEGEASTPSESGLQSAEKSKLGGDDAKPSGGLFKNDKSGIKAKTKGGSSSNRKYAAAAAGISAIMAITGASFLLVLLPSLAVKHVMSNLKSAFNDRIEYAIQAREQKYVEKYIQKIITPSLKTCGTAISKDCASIIPGTGVVGRTFTIWRDNRIESKLFENYGIEFRASTKSSTVDVYKNGKLLTQSGKRTVVKEVTDIIREETQSRGIRERWQVKSLLARKYKASKWCLLACQARDDFGNIKLSAIKKLKLKLVNLVVRPMNDKAAAYLMCFILDCGDAPDKVVEKAESAAAKRIASGLEDGALKKIAEDIGEKTMGQFLQEKMLEAILTPFLGEAAGKTAASAVPIVGQVYLALSITDQMNQIDKHIENKDISRFIKSVNESAYAEYYALWNVMDNEIQSGDTSLADVGASVDALKGFEKSRVYQKIVASSSSLPTVNCQDGKFLQGDNDPLACPEKKVQPKIFFEEWRATTAGQLVATVIFPLYHFCLPVIGCAGDLIHSALKAIGWVLGKISGLALDFLSILPGIGSVIDSLQNFVADKAKDFFDWMMSKMFRQVVNADAGGQEAFDQVAAGIDVTTNSFMKGEDTKDDGFIGMGAAQISEANQVVLDNAIHEQSNDDWQSKSVFARLFDSQDQRSLSYKAVTNLAFGMPNLKSNLFSVNYISSITNLISSIFTPRVRANGLTNRGDIFGVTQYGFPVNDPGITTDPDLLTDDACAQIATLREQQGVGWKIDPETKEKVYIISNPCALDKVVTDSMTKIFNLDSGVAKP